MSQGLIGEKLGSFRLEEILGAGAMGVVFRATHETTGRSAAVKIVHGDLGDKGKVFDRFQREAEILKQFRHPNIVRWLAWGRFKGTSYFAMEFVEGVTLEKILQDRNEIPWREVVDLSCQLCEALQYAHDQGVVHRDLKPSNIMVTADGKLKLTDFGIAKDLDRTTQLTAPGRTLGTAAYMAPEQIRGTPSVSHKTDLYALGILLYQLLTGRPPFEGSSAVVLMHNHLNEPPPRPSDRVEEIPKELDDLVVKLMAKSPSDRPWDAAAVGMVLNKLREQSEKGQAISMVHPPRDSAAANPARATVGDATSRPRKKSRKGTGMTGVRSGFATRAEDLGLPVQWLNRTTVETTGLVLALIAIGGFIGYWVWPPSAEYLYRHAVPLMQSSHRSDWLTARDEYFDPLASRFPDTPHMAEIQKWRDQILLDEAESRAKFLSSPVKTGPTEPRTNAERQFVSFDALATKAIADGNELMAAGYWKELAKLVNLDDPEDRKWNLLALKRADELEAKTRERRAFVEEQLVRADRALQSGRPNEAIAIRAMLVQQYGHFVDLADILGNTTSSPPPDAAPAPAPSPTPDVPSANPKEEPRSEGPKSKVE